MLTLLACSSAFLPAPVETPLLPEQVEGTEVEAPPALLLNEVMTRNDSIAMDPSLAFSDWVELYNASDEPIDLATVTLSDGDATWTGSGVLRPGLHALVWAERDLPFALSDEGEELTLAVGGAVTDRVATGQVGSDLAWARYPDGGTWELTIRPTPGGTNGRAPPDSTDPSSVLYDPTRVGVFEITIPDASWSSLSDSPYTEVPASLGYEGAWFPEVGIRIKGVYGSLRTLSQKTAFKVDLNAYADHRLRGVETLTFNNMVQDPSYTHETLAYRLFRDLGLPAPRTGWARLIVNGEDFGFYLDVESVDRTFLERWYSDPDGALYEGAYGVDFYTGDEALFEYDEGPDPDDRSDITEVASILEGEADDAAIAALEERVDLDQLLDVMALEALMYHWDGYTTANNYRVYHDPVTDRFQMIPWGTDQTFVNGYYQPYEGYGRLLTFCLENASCEARYGAALLARASDWDDAALEEELDELLAFLEPEIQDDPRYETDDATRQAYVDATRETILGSAERVRAAVR